jgi:hemolysin activation/secretion protein
MGVEGAAVGARTVCVAALVAMLVPVAASAQAIRGGDLPGRERERFVTPPPPLSQPVGPAIVLPSTAPPTGAERIQVNVRDICVKGATVYTKDQLAPLYADLIGHDVPVQALYELAKRITAKYGSDGYVLSRAIVPPQAFPPHGAVPCLQVIEGYIDQVEWPAAVAKYRNFFSDYTAKIIADRPANVRTLERYLLLAGDLPGLHFSASLRPSKTNDGAATLVVALVEKHLDAFGRFDNRGTPQRGPNEWLLGAYVNNMLRMHESFSINWAATTSTQELEYFAANWRQVLTSEGLTAFINASYGYGFPDIASFKVLDFKTRSLVVEAGFAQPVIRSRERNLTLTGFAFMSDNDSDSGLFGPLIEDSLRGFRLKADGDWADRFLGINQVNVTYSQGLQGFGSSNNNANLQDQVPTSRQYGRVDFEKIEATLSRTQPLFWTFSAFGSVYGQYAFDPLLVPEQCGYGGRFFGRAYDPSQLLGDHCVEAIGELRYDVPRFNPAFDQIQFYAFADYGRLWLLAPASTDPSVGLGGNFDAASAGGGLRLSLVNTFTADLSVAKAIHGIREDTRFFFILGAKY